MSEEKKELTLIEELEQEQAKYMQQRDFAQNSLNQAVGAIYANEQAIKKIREKESANESSLNPPLENGASDLPKE